MGESRREEGCPIRKEEIVLAYSTGVYNVLKLLHVLAAVIWVGGDVMIFILVTMLM